MIYLKMPDGKEYGVKKPLNDWFLVFNHNDNCDFRMTDKLNGLDWEFKPKEIQDVERG